MAKRKATEPEVKQYTLSMRLEFDTTVTVEATSEDEAMAKAKAGDFVDDGMPGASMCNWEVSSRRARCEG